jgi:hypothetical protein
VLQTGRSRVRVTMRWSFSIYLILPAHCDPGINSAPNGNEYQGSSWGGGGKGGRRVRLTTLPPSVSRLSRQNVGASTSHGRMGLHGLYRDSFTLPLPTIYTYLLQVVLSVKPFHQYYCYLLISRCVLHATSIVYFSIYSHCVRQRVQIVSIFIM